MSCDTCGLFLTGCAGMKERPCDKKEETFYCEVCYTEKPVSSKRNATRGGRKILACRECCEENYVRNFYAGL